MIDEVIMNVRLFFHFLRIKVKIYVSSNQSRKYKFSIAHSLPLLNVTNLP